ncbi:MAG: hypothetical protein KHX36_08605, partial [Clostridiales bacterium]|nr:hypothetical protein [Clostridiales bacterium]
AAWRLLSSKKFVHSTVSKQKISISTPLLYMPAFCVARYSCLLWLDWSVPKQKFRLERPDAIGGPSVPVDFTLTLLDIRRIT